MTGINSTLLTARSMANIGLDIGAGNLANVENPNYARREMVTEAKVTNGKVNGVGIAKIKRVFDQFLQKGLQIDITTLASAQTKSEGLEALQPFFGLFGKEQTATHKLTQLFIQFGNFVDNPTDAQAARNTINAARELAEQISTFADGVQAQRKVADEQIATAVTEINQILDDIAANSSDIARNRSSIDGLLDKQTALLEKLSEYLPVQAETRGAGGVLVSSTSGHPLVITNPRHLSFQQASGMSPLSTYPDGGLAGIQDADPTVGDITAKFTSGKLAALFDLRDNTLPKVQEMLDELAIAVEDMVNTVHNKGSTYPPLTALTGNVVIPGADNAERDTVGFAGNGILRVAVLNRADNVVQSHVDVDLSTIDTLGDLRTAVNALQADTATFDMRYTATGAIELVSGSPTLGIAMTSVGGDATITHLGEETSAGVSRAFGLNNFFEITPPQPPQSLTGLEVGKVVGDNIQFDNTIQIAVIDKISGAIIVAQDEPAPAAVTTIGDFIDVFNDAGSAIKTAVPTFTMGLNADGALTIDSGNSAYGIRIISKGGVAQDTVSGDSFDQLFKLTPDESQRRGAANSFRVSERLSPSPDIVRPDAVARAILTDGAIANGVTKGFASGDARIMDELRNLRDATHGFSQAGYLAQTDATLVKYAASFLGAVSTETANSKAATETAEDNKQASLENVLNHKGVNLENELTKFMDLINFMRATDTARMLVDQLNKEFLARVA